MPVNVISKTAEDALQDIHLGLKAAMTQLITNKDSEAAAEILRQVDVRFANFLNNAKIFS